MSDFNIPLTEMSRKVAFRNAVVNALNIEAISLAGSGYTLEITEEAKRQKAELLSASSEIVSVINAETYEIARDGIRALSTVRISVEKSRKSVKEPILTLGRKIDAVASEFTSDIDIEEKRVTGLMQAYANEQARIRAEAEAEARRAAAEAERQRLEAERKVREAEEQARRAEMLKTKAAQDKANASAEEAKRLAYEAEQKAKQEQAIVMDKSLASINASVPAGVKEELDYEVTNIAALYAAAPQLVEMMPKRREILAAIKQLQASGLPITIPGLTIKTIMKIR